MAGATARYGFPYGEETDSPPDVAADQQNLAEAIDQELRARTLVHKERTTNAGPVVVWTEVSGLTDSFTLTRLSRVELKFTAQSLVDDASTLGIVELHIATTAYRKLTLQPAIVGGVATGVPIAGSRVIDLAAGTYSASVWLNRLAGSGNVQLDAPTDSPMEFTVTNLGAV